MRARSSEVRLSTSWCSWWSASRGLPSWRSESSAPRSRDRVRAPDKASSARSVRVAAPKRKSGSRSGSGHRARRYAVHMDSGELVPGIAVYNLTRTDEPAPEIEPEPLNPALAVGKRRVRISYCGATPDVEEAMARLARWWAAGKYKQ